MQMHNAPEHDCIGCNDTFHTISGMLIHLEERCEDRRGASQPCMKRSRSSRVGTPTILASEPEIQA